MAAARILLVEDNADEEELAMFAFKKSGISSNEVTVVRDGQEAVDFLCGADAKAHGVDDLRVVFLDLNLPKLHGLEVLRKMRENDNTALLPVVILSSSDERKDIVEGYRSGANSYIRKSFDLGEFTANIKTMGDYWLDMNLISQK